MKTLTVLIADDHPIFRRGLREILEAEAGIRVAAEATTGDEALAMIELHRPDVVLLDIGMPGKTGIEVVRVLRSRGNTTPVAFLTMYDDEEFFDEGMDLGVKGYVLKESATLDIIACVRALGAGRAYISPKMSDAVMRRTGPDAAGGLDRLTPAERQVLRLIARGKTSKQIAAELSVSPRTIDNHRTNIAGKLKIRGTHSLLKFALQHQDRL